MIATWLNPNLTHWVEQTLTTTDGWRGPIQTVEIPHVNEELVNYTRKYLYNELPDDKSLQQLKGYHNTKFYGWW